MTLESRIRYLEEMSHFEREALVTTDKLANSVCPVWDTRAGNVRFGDLGRAERARY